MNCVVHIVIENDTDEISLQLDELQVQLSMFQSEFATKYVSYVFVTYFCEEIVQR